VPAALGPILLGWRGGGEGRGAVLRSPGGVGPDSCAGALVSWELGGVLCPPAAPYGRDGPDAEEGPIACKGASPMAEILGGMSQGRVDPSTGSPEPVEGEKKVKPPCQALAHDVKAGNFRGAMFASV